MSNSSLKIVPTGEDFGAIVTGINARNPVLSEDLMALKKAFITYHLLIFKNQFISDKELVGFANNFGIIMPLEKSNSISELRSSPQILVVANSAPEYGEYAHLGHDELLPHSDHQWASAPSRASFLLAIDVPKQSGDTYWIDLIQAYEELDKDTKERISDLKLITYNSFDSKSNATSARYYTGDKHKRSDKIFPHPLVRTHPESEKKILYLNCSYEVEVLGMNLIDGAELVQRLRQHIMQPRFHYQHKWSVGDLVYWDNQCTLHYRPAFDRDTRRILKRISLAGSCPF
jgi:taurine dioxygenase